MHLPGPVRAAVGLVASATDEARRLPDRALELPMLAVSTALQMSLRAQQRYARLAARGDEALARRAGDEPPAWATFDEPVPGGSVRAAAEQEDRRDARALLDQMFGPADGPPTAPQEPTAPPSPQEQAAPAPAAKKAAATRKTAAAKKTAATKAALARESAARSAAERTAATTTAKTAATTKTAPTRTAPTKTATKTAPTKPAARKRAATKAAPPAADTGKAVHSPRHTAPSRFDTVDVPTDTDTDDS